MVELSIDFVVNMVNGNFYDTNVEVAANLFVVSKKNNRLKKIDLTRDLEKIEKWAENNRFVAVVEKGDQTFICASSQIVESLKKQNELNIEGKQLSYCVLSDDDSERMSAIAMEALNLSENSLENEKKDHKIPPHETTKSFVRDYLAKISTKKDQTMTIDCLIYKMKNIPGKQILKFLRDMQETRNEQERRKKEDLIRQEVKSIDLKHAIFKKEILKNEVKKSEIKAQTKRLSS
ncbi:hypothetical protein [Candidatus Protochlamydia amoebophila]|uniref:Uncharacterized protein n=1 Tax=Protochlamydia amoebophila (strain UWE25) TaxID=264201 RepID=Q6MAN2_PARUW|nr:hypothetical protein [Candidatus Protochlamydia amoebophila]CAF24367.1 unnamed protein product [Candidatus Protochlamydia amoebophila UWE25]